MSSLIVLVAMATAQFMITSRFFQTQANWRAVGKHFALSLAITALIFMLWIGLAIALNVSDSSHGFVTLFIPFLFGALCVLIGSFITIMKTRNQR